MKGIEARTERQVSLHDNSGVVGILTCGRVRVWRQRMANRRGKVLASRNGLVDGDRDATSLVKQDLRIRLPSRVFDALTLMVVFGQKHVVDGKETRGFVDAIVSSGVEMGWGGIPKQEVRSRNARTHQQAIDHAINPGTRVIFQFELLKHSRI